METLNTNRKMETALEGLNALNTSIDFDAIIDASKSIDFEELKELVYQWISEQEIIYYHVAIEYLRSSDESLRESMALAAELGFETQDLNSELLATLLHQDDLMQKWRENQTDIEEILESVEA